MFYYVKTPFWLKKLYNRGLWQMPGNRKVIYLSFDDGPNPDITPFVLDELSKFNAKATFFCIGNNVVKYPEVYQRILDEGHAVGNHTYDHLNGWKTNKKKYLDNILSAKKYIDADLFRPPYGRISKAQASALKSNGIQFHTVMWSVLSGDFDNSISPEKCCNNVLKNASNGSIVVFHDSEKANIRMQYALPLVLQYFYERGFVFEKISINRK